MPVTKILYIGDVHAVPAELDDCNRLLALVRETIEKHRPDIVIHLGDGFHTHGVIHAEVVDFWQRAARVITTSTGGVPPHDSRRVLGNHETTGVLWIRDQRPPDPVGIPGDLCRRAHGLV